MPHALSLHFLRYGQYEFTYVHMFFEQLFSILGTQLCAEDLTTRTMNFTCMVSFDPVPTTYAICMCYRFMLLTVWCHVPVSMSIMLTLSCLSKLRGTGGSVTQLLSFVVFFSPSPPKKITCIIKWHQL